MNNEFLGKNCIITGAASGMGFSTAKKMAEAGANVALFDINAEGLQNAVRELSVYGTKLLPITADLSKTDNIHAAFEQAEQAFGQIDILINCAGVSTQELLIDIDEKTWDLEMNVNLRAVLLLSQLAAKNMIANKTAGGRIISIASQAGENPEYMHGAYCISKSGVIMLTKVLALELAKYGITVNAVAPGVVETPMIYGVAEGLGVSKEAFKAKMQKDIPLGRMADPGEVADLILFLASDKARYITGITTTIAGGTSF